MTFKVCEARCDQCLFSEKRTASKERMAQIVRECRRDDTYFNCHKHTIAKENVMCRGYYETQAAPQMLRIAERLDIVSFVPLPEENHDGI